MVSRLLLIPAFLLVSTMAFAHGGGQHVLNTATAIDDNHSDVKRTRGESVSVNLTKLARFKDRDNQASTELPTAGNRVVIEATRENQLLTGTEVDCYSTVKDVPVVTQ
jgi:hypothetical protein